MISCGCATARGIFSEHLLLDRLLEERMEVIVSSFLGMRLELISMKI